MTAHLTRGVVTKLVPPPESERRRVLALYGRRAAQSEASLSEEQYDVMVSYGRSTSEAAECIGEDLKGEGFRPWLDRAFGTSCFRS